MKIAVRFSSLVPVPSLFLLFLNYYYNPLTKQSLSWPSSL